MEDRAGIALNMAAAAVDAAKLDDVAKQLAARGIDVPKPSGQ